MLFLGKVLVPLSHSHLSTQLFKTMDRHMQVACQADEAALLDGAQLDTNRKAVEVVQHYEALQLALRSHTLRGL